ncbi:cold shock and DUF1294 domain-containing protein [Alteromonas sp. C1M14]|nr:cold shock and DUF1294 domain-containing protein [Alteromonas sp. C1M14]MBU2978819.1 cold shock and DUF1294 domain-containing protein [Alteromonas sp. C1M14]
MRTKGKLISWNEEKGFGFITPMAGGKQIFIHINGFSNRNRCPVVGEIVTYTQSSDKQGRPCAVKATVAGEKSSKKTKRNTSNVSMVVAVCFLIIVVLCVFATKIPIHILALYTAASLVTFTLYALDKSAAQKGGWRIQERTLHLLSLIGGWPGALIAQQKLRHKTQKQSFRIVFWITVLLNCGAFVWLFTEYGAATQIEYISRHLA